MIIVFGCDNIIELIERITFALTLYKITKEKILITGSYEESLIMIYHIKKNISDINDNNFNNYVLVEDKSQDTIDNIINSFLILKNLNVSLENTKYHIVSSNYHITRIQYIISILNLPYSFYYHPVKLAINSLIIFKINNESKIFSNIEHYKNLIINKNKIIIDFVRHAESEYNSGQDKIKRNPNITELGIKQSKELKGTYDIIITSNLVRTKQTLQYSSLQYTLTVENNLCREYNDGTNCNYLDNEEIKKETITELNERIIKFKNYLQNISILYNKIMVISHGIFMRHILNTNKNISNCELISFNFNKI